MSHEKNVDQAISSAMKLTRGLVNPAQIRQIVEMGLRIVNLSSTYDEAKELELCRAAWALDCSAPFPDFWMGWQACARARAEVPHE